MLKYLVVALAMVSAPVAACEIGGCASYPSGSVVLQPETRELTAEERRHLIYDAACADCKRGCSKNAHVALCRQSRNMQ